VSPEINKVWVWLPYGLGLAGRIIGTFLGFISGLSNNSDLLMVASVCSLAGQTAWTTSTVMSLVYSGRWSGEARQRLTFAPSYSPKNGSGISMVFHF